MRAESNQSVLASLSILAVVWLVPVPVAGGQATAAAAKAQTQNAAAKPKAAAGEMRTPWGDPDLQGLWTNWHQVPLERPAALGDKAVLTDEELAAAEKQAAANRARTQAPTAGTGSYNSFWLDGGKRSNRTSLIVDPPNGRLPFTPAAQQRQDVSQVFRFPERFPNAKPTVDSWEDRDAYERCITRGIPGAMVPAYYNHNYHILQTPGYVVIEVEMIHDARIIPVDGRPRLPDSVRQWNGDSRGHWEGKTLVVETANFNGKVKDHNTFAFGTAQNGRVVERFTRIDADTIDYQLRVEDPYAFTTPWMASMPMTKIETPLFEYACHEGNYSIPDILAGARMQENATNETTKK